MVPPMKFCTLFPVKFSVYHVHIFSSKYKEDDIRKNLIFVKKYKGGPYKIFIFFKKYKGEPYEKIRIFSTYEKIHIFLKNIRVDHMKKYIFFEKIQGGTI